MLIQGTPLIHMLNQFRVLWCMGGFGSGKTLGAFELASSLYETGRYRYILGNVNSVWTDSPEKVQLRDDTFVDAIVILDEGGLFMRLSRDADSFLLGLRKLNITIIVPSVLPPAQRIKALQVQRILNGNAFGLPLWIYEYRLNVGSEKEKAYYAIWKPQQIYGIYDTLDYPVDDCFLSEWFDYWMVTARSKRPEWVTWGHPPDYEKRGKRNSGASGADIGLEEIRGLAEEIIDRQNETDDALSFYANKVTNKGNRRGH